MKVLDISKSLYIAIILCTLVFLRTGQSFAAVTSRADSLEKAKKHFSFAVQYKNSDNFEKAFKNYETSITFNDTVYQVHYSFADLLMKMNSVEYAKREFLNALKLNKAHFNSAAMLSRLYYEEAKYDSALVMYEAMHRMLPERLTILSGIAELRTYLGMHKEALDAYMELIDKGEDSFDNLMKASQAAEKLENMKLAGDLISQALEKKPYDAAALKSAVRIRTALGDTRLAISRLRQLAIADSSDTIALIRLENLCKKYGDTEQLIWALSEHQRRSPNDISLIGKLAELLLREGKTAEGVAYIRKGLKIYPGDGKLRILLGDYYLKKGENEKALEEFRIALRDEKWRSSAQQFIWKIERPETDSEKAEREFFERGNGDDQEK